MALEVHLVTPEREVWSGEAEMIVARGVDGDVGILVGHAPLLIRLAIGPLKIRNGDVVEYAVVDGGFLHVSTESGSTRVDVLASHTELAHEIDLAAARFRKEQAEAKLQNHDTHTAEAEIAAARSELSKALARLTLAG